MRARAVTAAPTSTMPGVAMSNGECQCPQARAWREYWTVEAITSRLAHEIDLYRRICHERWTAAMRDAAGAVRAQGTSHAELERRRREKAPWPPS